MRETYNAADEEATARSAVSFNVIPVNPFAIRNARCGKSAAVAALATHDHDAVPWLNWSQWLRRETRRAAAGYEVPPGRLR